MKFKCSKCKIYKPPSAFSKNKRTKTELNYWCKKCFNAYKTKNRHKIVGATYEKIGIYNKIKAYSKTVSRKETVRHKKYNQGYVISANLEYYQLKYNGSHLGNYNTREACEQVIAKHKLRIAKRKLEDAQLEHDDYYDNL